MNMKRNRDVLNLDRYRCYLVRDSTDVGPSLVLRLGAWLLVLVPSSRRKHYRLDIIIYFIYLLSRAVLCTINACKRVLLKELSNAVSAS
jgi:hypothetical protein